MNAYDKLAAQLYDAKMLIERLGRQNTLFKSQLKALRAYREPLPVIIEPGKKQMCGNCGELIYTRYKFCCECGQALKWK